MSVEGPNEFGPRPLHLRAPNRFGPFNGPGNLFGFYDPAQTNIRPSWGEVGSHPNFSSGAPHFVRTFGPARPTDLPTHFREAC